MIDQSQLRCALSRQPERNSPLLKAKIIILKHDFSTKKVKKLVSKLVTFVPERRSRAPATTLQRRPRGARLHGLDLVDLPGLAVPAPGAHHGLLLPRGSQGM